MHLPVTPRKQDLLEMYEYNCLIINGVVNGPAELCYMLITVLARHLVVQNDTLLIDKH